jgi:hypothetical protein
MSNYLALRSSAAPTLTVNLLTISTLTGSTIYGSTMFTSSIVANGLTLSTITVSTINGSLPGTGSGTGSPSTMVSIGASTTQSNNFSGGSFTTGWGSTLTGLTAITDIAVSHSGRYQLAVQNGTSTIRSSAMAGITWDSLTGANGLPAGATAYPQATAAGVPAYTSISASATGQYQLASVHGGLLYVCANGTSATPTFTAVGMGTPTIYFPFEGSTIDVMTGNTPTVTGSPGYVTGVVGSQALNLMNTLGPSISAPAIQYIRASWSGSAKWTVSFWFNMQSYSTGQTQSTLFSSYEDTLLIMIYNNSLGLYTNSAIQIATSTQPVMNTWHYVTYIHQNNGLCSLYLNNSLVGTYNNPSALGTATRFSLGTYNAVALYPFNGYIDDFRIYNSAVTFSPIVPMNWSHTAVSATGQYMLAACASGGVFQSSNYGITWTQVSASVLNPGQVPYTIGGPTIQPNSASATSATWTANGATWTVSASTVFQAGFEAYRIFDNASGASTWASGSNYNATGAYTGGVVTSILGSVGNISGDWIQIQSSTPLVINSYSFAGADIVQWPKTYFIVGSNDNTNWYPIHSASLPSSPAGSTLYATPTSTVVINLSGSQTVSTSGGSVIATTIAYSYSTNSYTYFRLIGSTLCGAGGNFCLSEWYINFATPLPLYVAPRSTIATITPQQTGLTMATWAANGVNWTASASTILNSSHDAYRAFNNDYTSRWVVSSVTYSTAGNSSGQTTTIQGTLGTVTGDWLQIQSSVPLVMTSYQFANGYVPPETMLSRLPRTFHIVGSNDGLIWYPIQSGTGATTPSTSSYTLINNVIVVNRQSTQTFGSSTLTTAIYPPTTTNAYTYFRLVCLSVYASAADVVDIGEWLVNFSTVAPAPSNTNLLTVIPQQSGLAVNNWTTANGVSWVVSASSILSGYTAYSLFSNTIASGWANSVSTAYTSSGYSGSYSTFVLGTIGVLITGEWVQIQTSVPLALSSYSYASSVTFSQLPQTYYIVGSTDGINWYPIHYCSAMSTNPFTSSVAPRTYLPVTSSGQVSFTGNVTATGTFETYSTSTNAYTYFRFITRTIYNSTAAYVQIAQIYYNFTAATLPSVNALAISNTNMMVSAVGATAPNRTGLPSSGNAVTTSPWTINGVTWTARASSVFDPNGTTGITNAFNNSRTFEWVPLSATYTTAGNSSPHTTDVQGITPITIRGEWLQIQSSVPLVMASYRFATGNLTARTPKTYYIVGSNDGETWHPIQYGAGGAVTTTPGYTDVPGLIIVNSRSTQTFGSSTITTSTYSTTTNTYTFFRLICLSNYTGSNDVISLGEWYINFQTGSIHTSPNNGSTWTSALTAPINAHVLATTGSYVITSYNQTAYVYSNGISGIYTTPTLTGINANIEDASISASGQYMVLVTLGTTNNVFYSANYGQLWTALSIGNSAIVSCAMSADGSYLTVSNATTVYTLNRNTQGFSVAIGNQAGAVNQAQNAIAIGNQAGIVNQSANSIVLNASGAALDAPFSGFFAAPISNYTSSYAPSFNLLGYGSDSQIVQSSAMTVLQNGYIGIGTTAPVTLLDIRTTNLNLSTGINQNQRVSMIINQGAAGSFNGTFGGYMESGVNYGVSHYLALGTVAWSGTSSTFDERIRILGTGNVGVGTTTPAYPLHVVGNINLTGSILYNGVAITTGIGSIWTAGAGGVAYYNGGNVGIGTATPGYAQTISATGFILLELQRTSASTNYGSGIVHSLVSSGFRGEYVRTGGASNGTTATTSQTQANGVYFIDLANAGVFKSDVNALYSAFYMSNTSASFNGPNVGIGTVAPATALDVVGTIQSQTAFQSNANVNNAAMGPLQAVYLGQYGAAAPRGTSVRIGDIVGAAYYINTGSHNLSFYKDVSGGNAVPALQILGVNATNATPTVYVQNSLGIGTTPNGVNSLTVYGNGAFIQGTSVGTTTANNVGNFGLRISQVAAVSNTVGQIIGQMCFHGFGRPYASSFVRSITDATNGFDDAGALAFGVSSGGLGAAEAVRISSAGYVGIGTNAPVALLNLLGETCPTSTITNVSNFNGTASIVLNSNATLANRTIYMGCGTMGGGGGSGIAMWRGGSFDTYLQVYTNSVSNQASGALMAGPYVANGATSWTNASDMRLKQDWQDIDHVLDKLLVLTTGSFQWKDQPHRSRCYGLIAQEVQVHFPEMISTDSQGYLGIQYTEMVPVAIKAIQVLTQEVKDLKSQIVSLSDSLAGLLTWAQAQGFSG